MLVSTTAFRRPQFRRIDIMQLVCTSCGAKNRIPDDRIDDQPKCGKCGTPLLDAAPFALSDASFGRYVEGSDLPVVVDFWADWCGPCKMMAPHYAKAAESLPHMRFAKLDTEASPLTSRQFNIRSIPTMVLYRGGKEVARKCGAMSSTDIATWLKSQ
jgi:thioredoxin 2